MGTINQGSIVLKYPISFQENSAQKEVDDLIQEMKIMQEIGSHPHVVTILGVCTEQGENYFWPALEALSNWASEVIPGTYFLAKFWARSNISWRAKRFPTLEKCWLHANLNLHQGCTSADIECFVWVANMFRVLVPASDWSRAQMPSSHWSHWSFQSRTCW